MNRDWMSGILVGSLYSPRWPDRNTDINWNQISGVTTFNEIDYKGWKKYYFNSDIPLTRERNGSDQLTSYRYPFVIRSSGPRFLLASAAQEICESLIKLASLTNKITSPRIDVTQLVNDLTSSPNTYSISSVYSRIDGYGQSLRSIIMYGADIADAKIFRDILPKLSPYRVGLRDPQTHEEILTVGSKGDLSFNYRGNEGFAEVDQALRFLSTHSYVDWLSE